ncbi:MAG: nitroreductase family protein [Muribaculaceae bacterium]
MKKYIFFALFAAIAMAVGAEVLPKANTTGGKPLMEAVANRKSDRDMTASGTVSKQQLSDMLWAAWGITHDGKRTVATAMNRQELSVYVVTPEGASLYDASNNSLEKVNDADLRELVGMQKFATECPLNIVFVVDTNLQPEASMQGYSAGAASQNIYLYCASEGLKTVVRASFKREELHKALQLPSHKRVLFIQTVGK